ncbi:MAG: MFS transporter [Patescibacteria group bacterium]
MHHQRRFFCRFRKTKPLFNKQLKVLLVTNSMILVAIAMLGPIYALFVGKIGGDLLDASLTSAMLAFAAGVTSLATGVFSDKVKENELIVVAGYIIVGIGFLLYTICDSIWFLLLIQVIIGLGEAIYNPAFDAVYSKHCTDDHVGKQWGAWESINSFSIAGGAVIGGLIATSLGFNALFITMALLCFSSAIYIYQLPRKLL